ncbi:MAG: hypothetical protein ACKOE4_08595 [Candidatus Kapaibacterium sp.]
MRLEVRHCMALCVDLQERLFPHIHEHDALADRCIRLIKGLRVLGVPIAVTEQYVKGLGTTIPSISEALGEHEAIEKITFSCCGADAVEASAWSPTSSGDRVRNRDARVRSPDRAGSSGSGSDGCGCR